MKKSRFKSPKDGFKIILNFHIGGPEKLAKIYFSINQADKNILC